MTLYVHPDVHDSGLTIVQTASERLVLLSADPAGNYASVAAATLAEVAVVDADFVIANGDTSGRKITVGAKSTSVDVEGDPVIAAVVDDTNSRILLATDETTVQTLYAGNTVNIPSFAYESRDPA